MQDQQREVHDVHIVQGVNKTHQPFLKLSWVSLVRISWASLKTRVSVCAPSRPIGWVALRCTACSWEVLIENSPFRVHKGCSLPRHWGLFLSYDGQPFEGLKSVESIGFLGVYFDSLLPAFKAVPCTWFSGTGSSSLEPSFFETQSLNAI